MATWCCKCGGPRATLLCRTFEWWTPVSSHIGNRAGLAVGMSQRPPRPVFLRVPVVVNAAHWSPLGPSDGTPAAAAQSTIAETSGQIAVSCHVSSSTPISPPFVFPSAVSQGSGPVRSTEAPSHPVREFSASWPTRLFLSRVPVRDWTVYAPASASSYHQQAPVTALGVTRSGRSYIKPPPPSQ
jgi:hypothetical protein